MIIDEEPELADMIQNYLQKDEYNVIKVNNSREALAIIENENINLMLIDTQMPGSSKHALFSMDPNSKLDISNIDDFLQKPFTKEDLVNFVKKSFKKIEGE